MHYFHRILLTLFVFLQTHAEKLSKVYQPLRSALGNRSKISVAHLLAARQDFSKILRTSSGKIREKTACAINKVGDAQCSHNVFSVSCVRYEPFHILQLHVEKLNHDTDT